MTGIDESKRNVFLYLIKFIILGPSFIDEYISSLKLLIQKYQCQDNWIIIIVKMEPMEDSINNRQHKKHEMVVANHKKNKQLGTFQTMSDIFRRLPLPRLEKTQYKFIFDHLKDNVQSLLSQENKLVQIQLAEQDKIQAIKVQISRIPALVDQEEIQRQQLDSKAPLFQSLIYLKNQDNLNFKTFEGRMESFLHQSQYINFQKIKDEIPTVKLFMEESEPLRKHRLAFVNQNTIIFSQKSFPSSYQIEKRAEVLAKLYLLNLYREESQKLLTLDKNEENDLEKKRQINKIKHEMDIEKMREGELIEDMDLLKQVIKIIDLIEKKMNAQAYEQFRTKNGIRATQIKRSLQKLKKNLSDQPAPRLKLKMLIAYKYKKGW